MTKEDLVVRFLKLLPEENYNEQTLSLLAGIIDQNKDEKISLDEFITIERSLCQPDALYRMAFQLFDGDGDGTVKFTEFKEIITKTALHKNFPFDLESSFVQLYFGKKKDRRLFVSFFSFFI